MYSLVKLAVEVSGRIPIPAVKVAERAKEDDEVIAVALYGSYVRREYSGMSDIDICILLKSRKYTPEEIHSKRMQYTEAAASDQADVQVFQQLPLQLKCSVLKEAKMVLVRDEDALYELAFQTVKEYEDFRKHYKEYLAGMVGGESG